MLTENDGVRVMAVNRSAWMADAELITDTSIARWAQDRQSGDLRRADFQVPSGFDRYCRVFHRVQGETEDLPWSHFADKAGVAMHQRIKWPDIDSRLDGPKEGSPQDGTMDDASFLRFLRVIRERSGSNSELRAGFWDGIYNFAILDAPTATLGLREHVLFTVGLDALIAAVDSSVAQAPGVLWPADRSWYMSTDIDYNSTIISGSSGLIEALIADRLLEVIEISPDLDLTRPAR